MGQFYHIIHGLEVVSDFFLPEAFIGGSGADVGICVSSTIAPCCDDVSDCQLVHADATRVVFRVRGVGTIQAEGGVRLLVQPDPGASDSRLRALIYGLGLTMILFERERFPLHGSSVEVDGCAVVFIGRSGAGKSTLVNALAERGCLVVSDDLVGVSDHQGKLIVQPGVNTLRLPNDSICAFGYDASRFSPADRAGKRWVPLSGCPDPHAMYPLALVMTLETGICVYPGRYTSRQAFAQLVHQSPWSQATHSMERSDVVMRYASRIVNEIPVVRMARTDSFADIDNLTTFVLGAVSEYRRGLI